MAKWANTTVLDGGLTYLKTNCTSMRLLSTYTAGDSAATCVANTLANVAMTSTDFTIAGASGVARTCTSASGKSSNATASGGGANMHIAFMIGTTEVIFVTDETSDQTIVSGNPINFPVIVVTSDQPI